MGQIEDMHTFVRIVDAGTISQAANQLGMAKSAVSRRLSELETRLNVQLLNRTTRKSSLTEAGKSYYLRARQIINDVNELHAVTSNAKVTLEGGLKIAVPHSFGLTHLAPVISEFSQLHPDIEFQIDFSDRQVDLVEEGFDVAVRIADLKDSSHIARKLSTINLVLCASPDYLSNAGTPLAPEDLKQHELLGYNTLSDANLKLIDEKGKPHALRLHTKMSANNGEYLCAAASAGLGITALPTFICYKDLESQSLVRVLPDYSLQPLNAYALYPQTRHLSRRVRVFIDFLAGRFAGPPEWDICLDDEQSEISKN